MSFLYFQIQDIRTGSMSQRALKMSCLLQIRIINGASVPLESNFLSVKQPLYYSLFLMRRFTRIVFKYLNIQKIY